MSAPSPAPLNLASIQEFVRVADVERLVEVHRAPGDEYDTEAAAIFAALQSLPSAEFIVPTILGVMETIWQQSFSLSGEELAQRRPALLSLAKEIERAFSPESQPRSRQQILDSVANES